MLLIDGVFNRSFQLFLAVFRLTIFMSKLCVGSKPLFIFCQANGKLAPSFKFSSFISSHCLQKK